MDLDTSPLMSSMPPSERELGRTSEGTGTKMMMAVSKNGKLSEESGLNSSATSRNSSMRSMPTETDQSPSPSSRPGFMRTTDSPKRTT